MISAAKRADRILMVGYNRRFQGVWRTVHQQLAEQCIGTVRQISLQLAVHRRWYWEEQQIPQDLLTRLISATNWPDTFFDDVTNGTDWHADPVASGGGMFSNSGSHFVDLIIWLAGSSPARVFALSDSLGFPAECLLNIQAQLKNGVQVSIVSADVPAGGSSGQGRLTIVGEQGIMTHDVAQPNEVWLHQAGEARQIVPSYADSSAATAFVDAILNEGPVLSGFEDALGTVIFNESIYRSAKEEQVVVS